MSCELRFWSLTAKNYESGSPRQGPRFSSGFRPFRTTRIILRNGRPLKMLSQVSAFSNGMFWDFLIGERKVRQRWGKQASCFSHQNTQGGLQRMIPPKNRYDAK